MRDYYYALGVDADCTLTEIKEAYRKLSKKFHPDLNPGDAYFEDRYRQIQEAYDTLSDPDRRTRYDIELKKFKSGYIRYFHSPRYGPADQRFQNRPYRFKSGRPGMGIIITIIILVVIFGAYAVKYVAHTKPPVANQVAAVDSVVSHPVKKHKKKHFLAVKTAHAAIKHNADTVKAVTRVPVAVVKSTIIKLPIVKPASPSVDTANQRRPEKAFLYATYVHANQTGVVNMRESDDFNSDIVKTIPANAMVLVLQRGDAYYKVNFNNNIGYIPKWALKTK
jgi:hypothetical protein